ncbi:MAG: class I SAM-dependent methyltransferase [Lachnospiraceae bacterium]|nr:class I SAM-dependent methyltransferase [Lachnospiraceae bacterium]
MILSKRLETIISMIPRGARIADVGCDHGFVTIESLKRGIAAEACALDVNRDPLEKAKQNAFLNGVKEKISFYLSDGLKKLPEGKADTVIIAGMGGLLMGRIISDAPVNVKNGVKHYILSPQSELSAFRHLLEENGIAIRDEKIIFDEGKYYPVMFAEPDAAVSCYGSEIEYKFGKAFFEKGNSDYIEYLKHEISADEKLLGISSLPEDRRTEFQKEIEELKKMLAGS